MRIAIANAKGGVAKTTSSIYIASVIVSRGGRAVVYDADPQSSASLWASAAEQTAGPLTFDVLPANQATLRQLAAGSIRTNGRSSTRRRRGRPWTWPSRRPTS